MSDSNRRRNALGEKDKVRFRGRELVLHRMEIGTETANVIEINIEIVGGGIEVPHRSRARRGVQLGEFLSPPPPSPPESDSVLVFFKD